MIKNIKLTPKQERFCLAYLETGNASEAYRRAYSTANMKSETINRNAKALTDHNKISTRMVELRQHVESAGLISYESHLKKLAELRDGAVSRGNDGSAIVAEVNRGKVAGFYVNHYHHTGRIEAKEISDAQLEIIAAGSSSGVTE